MPRQVTISPSGRLQSTAVVTADHHRAGMGWRGQEYKLWCSCGWKSAGEAERSEIEDIWEAHSGRRLDWW